MERRVGPEHKDTILLLPGVTAEGKLSEYRRKHPDAPEPDFIVIQFVEPAERKDD